MARILVGVDREPTAERLADYLASALADGDEVCVINSLQGGDETTSDEMADGERALDAFVEALGESVVVERHQYVRGNEPVEDLLAAAQDFGVDEFVIGIRKRSPVGKVVFGSTAQHLLLEVDRPVRCVPLVDSEFE
jgi:nucleotide-binding universal stress UspA family protein